MKEVLPTDQAVHQTHPSDASFSSGNQALVVPDIEAFMSFNQGEAAEGLFMFLRELWQANGFVTGPVVRDDRLELTESRASRWVSHALLRSSYRGLSETETATRIPVFQEYKRRKATHGAIPRQDEARRAASAKQLETFLKQAPDVCGLQGVETFSLTWGRSASDTGRHVRGLVTHLAYHLDERAREYDLPPMLAGYPAYPHLGSARVQAFVDELPLYAAIPRLEPTYEQLYSSIGGHLRELLGTD